MKRYEVGGRYLRVSDEMKGKMLGMVSINTSPNMNVMCLRNRKIKGSICASCYSFQSEAYLPKCRDAWTENGRVLSDKIIKDRDIPIFNYRVIRVNAQGDFINRVHYRNIIKIVEMNPASMFSIFTKNLKVIRGVGLVKLDNLVYVYSALMKDRLKINKPEGFNKTFSVYTRKYIRENSGIELNCAGRSCMKCMVCYSDNGVERVNELVKWSGDRVKE